MAEVPVPVGLLPNLYVGVGACTVGASPATGSMINLGMIGVDISGKILFRYNVNLQELPKAKFRIANDSKWRAQHLAETRKAITQEPLENPEEALTDLDHRLAELRKKYYPTFVTWEGARLWQWLNYYFDRFLGRNPLEGRMTCLESYNWGASGEMEQPCIARGVAIPPELNGLPEHGGLVWAYRHAMTFARLLMEQSLLTESRRLTEIKK